MRYFKVSADHFESWVKFDRAEDNEYLAKLDVKHLKCQTPQLPLEVSWAEGPAKEKKWLDTHVYSPVFFVMSVKAAESLQEFLEFNGFFIATSGLSGNYIIYNVTSVIDDAFDWENSEIKGDINHLSEIIRATIFEDKIHGTHVFKLAESRVDIFVSELFKNKVEDSHLTGFIFEEVDLI